MFRLCLAFTVFMRVTVKAYPPPPPPPTFVLLSYMQCLHSNQVSSLAIPNHMSAIKAKLALFGLPIQTFTRPWFCIVRFKTIIDIDTLQLIVRVCHSTYMGQIFKAVYTLAFFSFLRLSNLVPHTEQLCSPLYTLARGDIILDPPGIQLLVKLSKTLHINRVKILKIPSLETNPVCPVQAIKMY